MKKVLFASFFAAASLMGLSACMNGDYDATPLSTNGGTNVLNQNNNNGGGGGGNGDPSQASYYTWNGTDPMSAKIDGADFLATGATVIEAGGNILVQGSSASGNTLNVGFPSSTGNNTLIPINATSMAASGYMEGSTGYASGAGTGGYLYVMENDATHCKGKWYANVKDPFGGASKNISEGYFNVTK